MKITYSTLLALIFTFAIGCVQEEIQSPENSGEDLVERRTDCPSCGFNLSEIRQELAEIFPNCDITFEPSVPVDGQIFIDCETTVDFTVFVCGNPTEIPLSYTCEIPCPSWCLDPCPEIDVDIISEEAEGCVYIIIFDCEDELFINYATVAVNQSKNVCSYTAQISPGDSLIVTTRSPDGEWCTEKYFCDYPNSPICEIFLEEWVDYNETWTMEDAGAWCLCFDPFCVPDQLIVKVDQIEMVNSGFLSRTCDHEQCFGDCAVNQVTINCDENPPCYTFSWTEGSIVNIMVKTDPCNDGDTKYQLYCCDFH